jgi:hypothetical protein
MKSLCDFMKSRSAASEFEIFHNHDLFSENR